MPAPRLLTGGLHMNQIFRAAVLRTPAAAAEFCADRLDRTQLEYCIEHAPREILKFGAHRLQPEEIDQLASVYTATAVHYAAAYLSPDGLMSHVPKNARTILEQIGNPE